MSQIAWFTALALFVSASAGAAPKKVDPSLLLPEPTRADVLYKQGGSSRNVLDFYQASQPGPRPTLIFLHGGGWRGSKAGRDKLLQPFLARGWNVVNVEYRVAPRDRAPAALVDARCAIAWVRKHHRELRADPDRLVISGSSAGGQLALMASLANLPAAYRCDQDDVGERSPVAAGVIWWGVVDMEGVAEKTPPLRSAVSWIGNRSDAAEMLRRMSPTQNIAAGMPPMLLVHGTRDATAPFAHAAAFHRKLRDASVPSKLVVVPEGKHGGFSAKRMRSIFGDIFAFLNGRGID